MIIPVLLTTVLSARGSNKPVVGLKKLSVVTPNPAPLMVPLLLIILSATDMDTPAAGTELKSSRVPLPRIVPPLLIVRAPPCDNTPIWAPVIVPSTAFSIFTGPTIPLATPDSVVPVISPLFDNVAPPRLPPKRKPSAPVTVPVFVTVPIPLEPFWAVDWINAPATLPWRSPALSMVPPPDKITPKRSPVIVPAASLVTLPTLVSVDAS